MLPSVLAVPRELVRTAGSIVGRWGNWQDQGPDWVWRKEEWRLERELGGLVGRGYHLLRWS